MPGQSASVLPGAYAAALQEATAKASRRDTPAQALRTGGVIAGAVALLGLLLGVAWWWLAPAVPLYSLGADGAVGADPESERAIAQDGWFVLLAAAAGLVSGCAAHWYRRRGAAAVLGLAVGSLLGSLLGWRLGVLLGPGTDVAARAAEVGEGELFDAPLELHAPGALLIWPAIAVVAFLILTAVLLEPEEAELRRLLAEWPEHAAEHPAPWAGPAPEAPHPATAAPSPPTSEAPPPPGASPSAFPRKTDEQSGT
ncbi:hypothetical protein [Allostreptomyces psammosilenae]|uniref:ABC transporter permease n=1 Tax=Allostreptomyces psammosilenae TaxID=1892865 RepID=A0A852ZXQ8_9ACTN|nr:hypothetical protein [Allostreptomyces psammosilenae]NYI07126.1 hypothetical protein [Allostreptomyces psammosilenae]